MLEDVRRAIGRFFLHIYKTLLNRYATSDDIVLTGLKDLDANLSL